jgi:branched-chain amino acid transport system permease protein
MGLVAVVVGLIASAVLASAVLPPWAVFLGTIVLSKGLVVLGLMVSWRAGLVPFGQALYFGIGGYVAGVAGLQFAVHDLFARVLLGGATAGVVAFLLGFLLCRYRGIFFAMLTMAFSMLLYGVLVQSEPFGSTDGFNVSAPTIFGVTLVDALRVKVQFVLVAAISVGCALGVRALLRSTMGQMATALRYNEVRLEYLGYSANRVAHTLLVLSALLAGVGGTLTALAVGHCDPDMVKWTTSGEFVFVTILAGPAHVAAPFIGSLLFETVRTYALQYVPNAWQSILGTAMLATIVLAPNGLSTVFLRSAAAPSRS